MSQSINTSAAPSGRSGENRQTGESGGGGITGNSKQDEQRKGQNQRHRGQRSSNTGSKFKGKYDKLEGTIYDIGTLQSSQDLYNTTMRKIAESAARKYNEAREFWLGMIDLHLPPLIPPSPPEKDAGLADIKIYKMDLKEFRDWSQKRTLNMSKIFALILGQCLQTVCDRLEASDAWQSINQLSNVLELLRLIRQSMYTKATNQHPMVALIKAKRALQRFKQTKNMSNSEYLEKLKSLIEVYKHLGGEPGSASSRLEEFAGEDEDLHDSGTLAAVRARCRDEYLAIMLLLNSDPQRYGALMDDLINQYTQGVDHAFPTTITQAYDMIVNYRGAHLHNCNPRSSEDGMAYATVDGDGHDGPQGCGSGKGHGRASFPWTG